MIRAKRELEELLSQPEGRWSLADAALAVSRLDRPGLDPKTYEDRIDQVARTARARIGLAEHPRFVAAGISRALFIDFGLESNRDDGDASFCFLSRVLDGGPAAPIVCALLFAEVARQARRPFDIIALPQRVLMRRDFAGTPFLFDPGHLGRPVTIEECRQQLERESSGRVQFREGFLRPITPTQVIARLVSQLKRVYWRLCEYEQALAAVTLMLAIRPEDPREIRDRGRVLLLLKRHREAIDAFEAYLMHNPRGEDAYVVRMLIQEARTEMKNGTRQ